ncbi:unnamed protein product [Pleuronectes platessa]|uniref:Uncharacterized protein n=1 Tax=Pleuronectes platessa TaxID=8262 RepID=A0A9N7VY44_PLEPL|nr:unnamed protein product [Pleuronectes platessa]
MASEEMSMSGEQKRYEAVPLRVHQLSSCSSIRPQDPSSRLITIKGRLPLWISASDNYLSGRFLLGKKGIYLVPYVHEAGERNIVFTPGNPSHAFHTVNNLSPGKSFTLQGPVPFDPTAPEIQPLMLNQGTFHILISCH